MRVSRHYLVLAVVIPITILTAAFAANTTPDDSEDSCHLYTRAFERNDAGVFAVPSRFKWSVETSWRGEDEQGHDLPDNRIMLRLYDPDQNFTAVTAQMNLETAEKLQQELAEMIAKKRQDPNFQYRPKLYDASKIPIGRFKGVNENGEAIIEFESK